MIKQKNSFITGTMMIVISIIVGAFAAHGLKAVLDTEKLEGVNTAARYLMYSGLGLLILSFLDEAISKLPSRLITIGISLFSGSIFLLVFLNYSQINFPKILGLITPIGGLLMIIGWGLLLFKVLRSK